jgi:hypothetical protein
LEFKDLRSLSAGGVCQRGYLPARRKKRRAKCTFLVARRADSAAAI